MEQNTARSHGDGAVPLRYERKFRIETCARDVVEHVVLRHPHIFREIYAERYVNSIYYDSHQFRLYYNNVDGDAERGKVRVRWYGDMVGDHAGAMMECKRKFGHVGSKDSTRLGGLRVQPGVSGQELVGALDHDDVDPLLRATSRALRPVLLVRYRRRYYLSACARFRMTIDDQLQFVRMEPGVNGLTRCATDHAVILELKYTLEDDALGARVAAALPFRMTRNSKYVVGMNKLFVIE